MVFDIRGKRRHVVKVVYAILAILMAASLFLVTGGANIGSIFGGNSGESNVAVEYEKRAERLEAELQKQPGDEKLLANLTNNRLLAGQQRYVAGPNGEPLATVESRTQYQKASAAWSEYLKATQEPSPSLAQRMGSALFALAQISRSIPEAESNLDAAAEAQKIYAEKQPNLNSLSTQALYTLFTGNFKEAEELNAAAEKMANTKFQREQVGNQFDSTKKGAVEFQKQVEKSEKATEEAAKANKEAGGGAGANPESLENPLGLGGAGLAE
jgi:hypothetical protein